MAYRGGIDSKETTPRCIGAFMIPIMLFLIISIIGVTLCYTTGEHLWLQLIPFGLVLFIGSMIYLKRRYKYLIYRRPVQDYTEADGSRNQVPFPQQNERNHPNRSLSPVDAHNRRQEQLRGQNQDYRNLSPILHSSEEQGRAPDNQSGRHLASQSGNEAPPPSYSQVMGAMSREHSGITILPAYRPQ